MSGGEAFCEVSCGHFEVVGMACEGKGIDGRDVQMFGGYSYLVVESRRNRFRGNLPLRDGNSARLVEFGMNEVAASED